MKNKTAFTLLELAIVIIIIAALTVGILQSSSIVRSSRLSTAKALTSKSPVANINDLLFWYETTSKDSLKTAETIDGTQITTWYDINPNSIPGRQNTITRSASSAVTYETNGINDIPSISFDGTGVLSIATNYQGSHRYSTLFAVFQPSAVSSSTVTVFDGGASYATRSISFKSTAIGLYTTQFAWSGTSTNPASFSANTNYIAAANYNGTSSQAFLNDAVNKAGAGNLDPGTVSAASGITIGGNGAAGNKFSGYISEVIGYGRVLTTQERKDVMQYLSKKYNIKITL